LKSEQEIRERIKYWENSIQDWKENIYPDMTEATFMVMMGKLFTLRWVLNEGADV
jgi:hypothetical protein